jgi:hypothetical protein
VTSFLAVARQVRDLDLPWRNRLLSLRESVLRFAPYGFRATWHHLATSVSATGRFAEDPPSLLRAVDELEQARLLWLTKHEDYAARRRAEKAAGQRVPRRADRWHGNNWLIAYCPDFEHHPTERLAVVVRQVSAAHESGLDPLATCRACRRPLSEDLPCPGCGVDPRDLSPLRAPSHADTAHRWRELWLRNSVRPVS